MTINNRPLLSLLGRRCLCLVLAYPALFCAAQRLAAPGNGTPQGKRSPESCVAELDGLLERTFRDAREAGREVDIDALRGGRERIANECVSSLSLASVRPQQWAALARLYFEAHQDSKAFETVSRYVKSRVNKAGKAEVLLRAISFSVSLDWFPESVHRSAADAERAAYAEAYLKKIDLLGPAFVRQQMTANLGLAKHYLITGNKVAALEHQSRIIRLSQKLKVEEQKSALAEAVGELSMLAMMRCTVDGPDKALVIIKQIPSELINLSGRADEISTGIMRYSLAGRPAPQLLPRFTFNSGAEDNRTAGRVTVMLFAAHWCGPCQALYPQVAAIYENYRAKGLRVVLVTQLYGYFGDRKDLKPDEEAAAVHDYYVVQNKLSFPILIEDTSERKPSNATAAGHAVLYSFLPQVLVIDKKGETRAILLGALPGQEDRLRAKVEELLNEAAPLRNIIR